MLYYFQGPDTKGRQFIRHAIVENRKVAKMVQLPEGIGERFIVTGEKEKGKPQFCRMMQDSTGRFYLLGTTAIIPADSEDASPPNSTGDGTRSPA